jgi:zinc transport system substrate-binding protein
MVLGLLGFCVFLAASDPSHSAPAKLRVYVTNYPLKYFVERIGYKNVEVVLPVPRGLNPIFWMPDARTIAALQKADLIILNGATYEKWLALVSLPPSKMVDTSIGFKEEYIRIRDAVTHSHGPQGMHSHAGTRHTTWMDFQLAVRQARVIKKALTGLSPNLRDIFDVNYRTLEKDLMILDQRMERIVSENKNEPLLASHPIYDYFARRYSLNLKSVLWAPMVMPNASQWMKLRKVLSEYPAKWMIWEKEPIEESVERLKSMGIGSLVFDPCENVPENGDFLTVMERNVENLKMAFQ